MKRRFGPQTHLSPDDDSQRSSAVRPSAIVFGQNLATGLFFVGPEQIPEDIETGSSEGGGS